MKKRIVVLGMGGTISSVLNETGLSPGMSSSEILSKFPELDKYYDLEARELMAIDSSNLQPTDWCIIAKEVYADVKREDVDGVVIVHGTDTMTYTASALAFMIRKHGKPIVFTGSQIPLTEVGSDGRKNLIDSIRVAANADISENVIVFNSKIMRSVRTLKLREYDLNAFESTDPTIIGEVAYGLYIYDNATVTRSKNTAILDNTLNIKVAMLKVFPGMKPEMLISLMDMGYEGVILDAYGAGNVPILNYSLLDPIKILTDNGIPVVITSQCVFGTTELLYETGILAHNAGAIQGYDMNAEVALIKLMWALGKTSDLVEIAEIMHKNYVGEINPVIQKRKL